MAVVKNPGGNLTLPAPNAYGSNDNKRFVIHQDMAMLSGSTDPVGTVLFKGVIIIPRGYKRFGYNDLLQLQILAPGVNINYCVQCIYKEFR